ncbi:MULTISPECIES: LacI family DNA-binding transcriptional regulator [Streptomyces]|uniref:LacI family DNA-binding transcriptional regulator n=1 Tax=Streptomyces TaxID=1883 RepID=UPI000BE2F9EC
MGGYPGLSTADQRRDGFLHALRAHGVAHTEELELPGPYTRVSGCQCTWEALAAGLDFTAVFAGTDMVPTGALAALREAGLDVPGDISLIGFDDVPFAAGLSPALTTVRVPYEDLGRAAVRLALEREERLGGDDHVVRGTQLVIRQSVRTPS